MFDFDGTLSVLREGWESVMLPVMLESICGEQPAPLQVETEVRAFINRSTGVLTIRQMEWLAEAVKRYGYVRQPLAPLVYKAIFVERLMVRVTARIDQIQSGQLAPEGMCIAGAWDFLSGLSARRVDLYLASGSDHLAVVNEAEVLGMADFFEGRIYGALDHSQANSKECLMQRILDENNLAGPQLLVVGDGPVEIQEAKARRALTLGVASDEVNRSGWNPGKIQRLVDAGADLLVADFSHTSELLNLFA